jgi:flagellar biosynthetic protein FlhB
MADSSDKTEDPTPGRLEEAREKGNVAQSKEFAAALVFLGMALALYFGGKTILMKLAEMIKKYLSPEHFRIESPDEFMAVLGGVISDLLWLLGPMFFSVFVFGIAASVTQFGFLFTSEKLSPDISKIDPLNGFKRIFSKETAVEFAKSTLKLIVISGVLFLMFKGEFLRINEIAAQPINKSFAYLVSLLGDLFFVMLLFVSVLGVADFAIQKWLYIQRMRMSVQEVKEEMKNREGDPHIRARVRQIQRERARARMMQDVPKADVVVTNPTHVAVALEYKRGQMRAPRVLAKGAGFIAVKIKEMAAEHQIPIVEKKQLARYIYRNIEVGELIPESLYTAVAEVLAYVYKVRKKFVQRIMMKQGVA